MSDLLASGTVPNRPVTLRDIASRMEVDVATVSRALGDGRGVSKARADEIRSIAKMMGYRPKPLRRSRADALGLVVAPVGGETPSSGYFERMIFQVEVGVMNAGKHMHLHTHMIRPDQDDGVWPRFISENRVDGVLVLGHAPQSFYDRLKKEPIPTVAVNDLTVRTETDCVMCDPGPGIQDAVERLLSLGHRAIGLVLTQRRFPTVSKRLSAYTQTMRAAGHEPDPRWIIEDMPHGLKGGQQSIRNYISQQSMPTAIIFNDDWLAMGGIYELARHGYRIPDDVSVVGYDNTAISSDLTPALSSIDNQEKPLVTEALRVLQQRIDGLDTAARQQTIASELVWRDSCARVSSS